MIKVEIWILIAIRHRNRYKAFTKILVPKKLSEGYHAKILQVFHLRISLIHTIWKYKHTGIILSNSRFLLSTSILHHCQKFSKKELSSFHFETIGNIAREAKKKIVTNIMLCEKTRLSIFFIDFNCTLNSTFYDTWYCLFIYNICKL